jgi:uncharacterized protein (TIRG00374 family)
METSEDILALERETVGNGGNGKKSLFKQIFWFIFRIGLASAIIYWLVSKNYDKFMSNLEHINFWWLLPAIILYLAHMVICCWRWFKLAEVLKIDISFLEALALTMKAYFFSLVIPGGAIGGDVAKIGFLSQRSKEGTKVEGAFSILMDRMTGMAGLFTLAIIVTIFSIPTLMKVNFELIPLNTGLRILGIAGILGICIAGLTAMLMVFFHAKLEKIRPIGWLMRAGDKYTDGAVTRMTAAIDTYKGSLKLIFWMIVLSLFCVHLNLVVVVYLIMKSLGMSGFDPLSVLSAVVIGNIAGLIPLTVSGVGLRDVTILEILNAGGVPKSATIPLLFTAMILAGNILAGVFFIFDPSKKAVKKQAKNEGEKAES